MGLDIYHIKATAVKPANVHYTFRNHDVGFCNYVLEDEEPLFNVPFYYFHSYIQYISCPDDIERVYIIPKKPWTKQDIEEYLRAVSTRTQANTAIGQKSLAEGKRADEYIFLPEYEHIVLDCTDKAEQEAEALMAKLSKQGYFVMSYNPKYWVQVSCAPWVKRRGFYIKEVGYQRKGMEPEFWQRFCTGDIYHYALPEDFAFALQCAMDEQRELFKASFIDTYKQGASFISVSY